jgi:predicted peptidase
MHFPETESRIRLGSGTQQAGLCGKLRPTTPVLFSTADAISSRPRMLSGRGGYDCLIWLPDEAQAAPRQRWPLVLFLHGSAFRGTDISTVATHGLPRLMSGSPELTAPETNAAREIATRFIVAAPQCPHFEVWDDAAVLALLDELGTELPVDAARVYLTGLSMGGFGAWSVGIRYPERFAAIVPICGGGRVADVEQARRRHRDALHSLGVWAFHGAHDNVVPAEESERMVAALRDAGADDVRLTVYPDAEHDAWSETYANPELYAWLLGHER